MEILIQNMVCRHCVEAVIRTLTGLGLQNVSVSLGRASFDIPDDFDSTDGHVAPAGVDGNAGLDALFPRLDAALQAEGFCRIADHDHAVVEQIKRAVLHHLRDEHECRLNLSACIEDHLHISYDQASRIFRCLEGRTIERYAMLQKIEFVKELLGYGTMTLAAIADRTGFSSAAHLSRQFKHVTGMTTSAYLASRPSRTPLTEV